MGERPVIRVTAVVLRDDAGRMLLVRKRGTTAFMNPGGKPEPGESPRECGVRECREELGIELAPDAMVELGHFETDAANEDGHALQAWVFEHPWVPGVRASAEIEELGWLDMDADPLPEGLAPLIVQHLVPGLRGA